MFLTSDLVPFVYTLAPIEGNAARDVKRENGNQESPSLSLQNIQYVFIYKLINSGT